jgi:hypothetical protein
MRSGREGAPAEETHMNDNSAYYRAEAELIWKINHTSHDQLVYLLHAFVRRADPDVNRVLFQAFGVEEK